ncbi:MAG: hypothetical protein J3R72DRAFT_109030 [Linnemannia gamsii]|nr:MAG: hypothetical protein J3R72DRAFT_109030 [Linnemannia gamsii]
MFKSIFLVGLALAASLVVEAKPDIVFSTEKNQQGDHYRCEELEYQTCYTYGPGSFPSNIQSLKFTNYDFPDQKDFSITIYNDLYCNNYYDRWSFRQSDDGKDSINKWHSLTGVYSFKIANFQTSNVSQGNIGTKDKSNKPNCWRE